MMSIKFKLLSLTEDISSNTIVHLILIASVILLFLIGQGLTPGFLAPNHIATILRTASFLAIVAMGQTLVILTGGIDLSIGPMVTAGNVLGAMIVGGSQAMTPVGFLLIVGLGILIGGLNGVGITYIGISPLIMTLAAGSIVKGGVYLISHGAPKGNASPLLTFLGSGRIGGVPLVLLFAFFFGICTYFLLQRTTYGRKIYAVGGNEVATYHSGIDINQVKIPLYMISASLAGFLGFLITGYTKTAYLGIGSQYTLSSIAAVVIGGASLAGGRGRTTGTILGALILVLITSILNSLAVPEAARRLARGGIILLLLIVHRYMRQKQ